MAKAVKAEHAVNARHGQPSELVSPADKKKADQTDGGNTEPRGIDPRGRQLRGHVRVIDQKFSVVGIVDEASRPVREQQNR